MVWFHTIWLIQPSFVWLDQEYLFIYQKGLFDSEEDLVESTKFFAYLGENIGFKLIPNESELFRAIPESVFEPIRETFSISFDEKRSKINPNQPGLGFI